MKVMFLSHSSAVENMGGAELTLLHMIDHWRTLRPDVEFIAVARTPQGRLQPELDHRGVPHHTIDFDSWVLPVVRVSPAHVILTDRMDSEAVKWLANLMMAEQPDVVITNTIVSPWAAIAARHLGVVHVWMVHEFGDLDHGLDFRIGRAETFDDIGLLSDLVVANSVSVRDHVAQWIPESKLTIAYPVIDLVRDPPSVVGTDRAIPSLEGALNTVMVGRLAPSKGQWRLVRAIGRLRDEGVLVTATLVGGDDTQDGRDVLALVNELGLEDRIVSIGETDAPASFIAGAHLGVTASDSEAFGRVTIEYMALGKPVVASDAGANRELVRDGETGWLFDRGSIDDLVRVLREAHADLSEVSRRGRAARQAVDDGLATAHSLDDAIRRIEQAAGDGPQPMERLPNLIRDRLAFPKVVDAYARDQARLHEALYSSRTWRVGTLASRPLRWGMAIARRLGLRR